MRLSMLGVSLRATAASLAVLSCFVNPTSLWRDVQRRLAEAPWNTTEKLPGVVLVAVVLGTDGRLRDLRRTGSGFEWTAYF